MLGFAQAPSLVSLPDQFQGLGGGLARPSCRVGTRRSLLDWAHPQRARRVAARQHQGADKGGKPAHASGEEVDHDEPAQTLDSADGADQARQDVEDDQAEAE